jgi:HAD superfamily hydrolase (TIGR01549 family)
VLTTVAFDADHTLVDTREAVEVALNAVVADLGEPSLTLQIFRADAAQEWAREPDRPVWEQRRAAIAHTLTRVGRQGELDRVAELFFEVRFANSRPYPGVPEMLAKLRTEYKIGYATNGNSRAERCGLGGLFDFELYAHRDGVPKKPAAAFYEALMEMAHTVPSSVVYVGDDYEHDVEGPASWGMRTVWLNRSGKAVPGDVQPDAVIENLDDLPRILAGWR